METFLGMIAIFGFDYAPRGWAKCEGQLLSIAQNSALFSLLGTRYGGDGMNTFALPDLRGRTPIGPGQGPGLNPHSLGEKSGQQTVTLTASQLPAHNHMLRASNAAGNNSDPTGRLLANSGRGDDEYTDTAPNTDMNPAAIGITGGNQPFSVMQPYLVLNYCIATEGIFPSRN